MFLQDLWSFCIVNDTHCIEISSTATQLAIQTPISFINWKLKTAFFSYLVKKHTSTNTTNWVTYRAHIVVRQEQVLEYQTYPKWRK